jgi:plastocyanin
MLHIALATIAAAGALCVAASGAAAAAPAKHTVTIADMRYEPAVLTVKKGDSVTFVNKDIFPHTATAAGQFDSRTIEPQRKWTFRAMRAGEFPYICTLHPNMKGTLKVE